MGKSPFTMPGSGFYGKSNQSVSPGKYSSPAKEHGGAHHGTGTDWEHKHNERVAHPDGEVAHNKKKSPATYASPAKQDLQDKLKKQGKHYKKTAEVVARENQDITPSEQTEESKKVISKKTQDYVDYVDTKTDNKPKTPRDKYGNVIKT